MKIDIVNCFPFSKARLLSKLENRNHQLLFLRREGFFRALARLGRGLGLKLPSRGRHASCFCLPINTGSPCSFLAFQHTRQTFEYKVVFRPYCVPDCMYLSLCYCWRRWETVYAQFTGLISLYARA